MAEPDPLPLEVLPDEALVARVHNSPGGDLGAFTALVHRHERRVLANCRQLTGSAADAEDLTQEVLVKAYFGLKGFAGRSQFSSWLYRIKANHCINFNQMRARRRHLETVLPDRGDPARASGVGASVAATGLDRLIEREQGARIRLVLDAMSETLRVPLILRDGDGLSYEEVADALGIGLSAVKMRINRARKDFRARYRALDDTDDATTNPLSPEAP